MSGLPDFEALKKALTSRVRRSQGSSVGGGRAVTISRATGCGAQQIALDLARELERRGDDELGWSVLDRERLQQVKNDGDLAQLLEAGFSDPPLAGADPVSSRMLGTNPFVQPLPRDTTRTVRQLCRLGGVIILDRAACLMASDLERTVHVRIVGSVQRRIARVARDLGMGLREAETYVDDTDAARAVYFQDQLGISIDSPYHYHLILNTDRYPAWAVAPNIATVVERLPLPGEAPHRPRTTRRIRRGAVN